MSGYVWRVSGRRTEDKFYRLVGNVIYVYGAHEVVIFYAKNLFHSI